MQAMANYCRPVNLTAHQTQYQKIPALTYDNTCRNVKIKMSLVVQPLVVKIYKPNKIKTKIAQTAVKFEFELYLPNS